MKKGQDGLYPSDQELGIRPYRRYTVYMEHVIARIG